MNVLCTPICLLANGLCLVAISLSCRPASAQALQVPPKTDVIVSCEVTVDYIQNGVPKTSTACGTGPTEAAAKACALALALPSGTVTIVSKAFTCPPADVMTPCMSCDDPPGPTPPYVVARPTLWRVRVEARTWRDGTFDPDCCPDTIVRSGWGRTYCEAIQQAQQLLRRDAVKYCRGGLRCFYRPVVVESPASNCCCP